MDRARSLQGCLLGTAVGDAIGLPREGLSRRRAARRFGSPPLEHRLAFGFGMCSDDTEHACLTAQALIASGADAQRFARSLAWGLRWWLLGAPGGVGLATLRSILKLWAGASPDSSGVYSAGNGAAMRAAVIGVYAGDDEKLMRRLVRASSRLTHTDPRAEEGAYLVALAASIGAREGAADSRCDEFLARARGVIAGDELRASLDGMAEFLARGASAADFADHLGLATGVTGYVNHTVPAALFCFFRYHDDFREAVEQCVCLGGDSDSTGAIVGGLLGATLGPDAIPASWQDRLLEFPRSTAWIGALATRLAETTAGKRGEPLELLWPALLPRNALFAAIVVAHALRRLAPPY